MIWRNFEEDIQSPKQSRVSGKDLELLAVPMDRLGAFFLDFMLVYVLSGLLVSPLQKSLAEAQIMGQVNLVIAFAALTLLIHISTFVLYLSLSMSYQGQSIGQKVFGIRVVDVFTNEKLSFTKLIRRNLFLLLDVVLLFPLLAIFNDSYRRILHERVSDSISLSVGNRFAGPPTKQEMSFIRGLLIPAYLWIFAICLSIFSAAGDYLLEDDSWLSQLSASVPHCSQVLDSIEKYPRLKQEGENYRLMAALSLYSAGEIDSDCLLKEADAAFLTDMDLDFAYLAKSFALNEIEELSDEYLIKVCEASSSSEACLFSQMLGYWAEENYVRADANMEKLLESNKSFIQNFALKHLMKTKKYSQAYQIIEAQSNNPLLSKFLGEHRTKALWGMGREADASLSFSATRAFMDKSTAREQASWMCWQSLKRSCGAVDSSACREFDHKTNTEALITSDYEFLARLNHLECSGAKSASVSLSSYQMEISKSVEYFFSAYSNSEIGPYFQLLNESIFNDVPSYVQFEIIDRLSKKAQRLDQVKSLEVELFKLNSSGENWDPATRSLQKAFYRLGEKLQAQRFARRVLSLRHAGSLVIKNVALVAIQHNDPKFAKSILFKSKSTAISRRPASSRRNPKGKPYGEIRNSRELLNQKLRETIK